MDARAAGIDVLKAAAVGSTVCLDGHYAASGHTGYTVLRKTHSGYTVEQRPSGFVPTHQGLAFRKN